MAEEEKSTEAPADVKCPDCPPEGLPLWMGTFSDLVTLLLTFFVLLLSFAKTEVAKYDAALGSIRNAFGGNVLKAGQVLRTGKSPDDAPTIMESQAPVKPFPIDFLTSEGLLDKKEINRESAEQLNEMRLLLKQYELSDSVDIYEMPEGIKVRVKDKIYFQRGQVRLREQEGVQVEVFEKMVNLLRDNNWTVFVEGHAHRGEVGESKDLDAIDLSAQRATVVSRILQKRGISPDRITTVFYGDSRPEKLTGTDKDEDQLNRRVEFIIRKTDLRSPGHPVPAR